MEDRKEIFDNYIESYKLLNIPEKREKLISSLKDLIAVFNFFAESDNIRLDYIRSNQTFDLNNEEDFLVASMVYLEIAKDIIGQYLYHKTN